MAKLIFVLLAIISASAVKSVSSAAVPSDVKTVKDESTRAKTTEEIGGFVLFRRDSSGKIEYLLVEKASEPGDWSPPKGHVEKGEIPVDAAFREMREETTLLPQHYSPMLGFFEYFEYETNDGDKKHVNLWPAQLTALDHPIVLSEESSDYKWADTTETLQIVKKQYKQAFVNILQKLYCHFDSNAC